MKKILAALIAVMMVLSMAVACSSPEEAAAPAQEAAPAAEAQQEAAAPAADDEDDENDEDAVKNINIEFFTTFSFDTEVQKSIEDALNAIAEPEIGVHANIHFNTPATVSNLVNIGIPAGDQIDLFCFNPVPGCSIATMAAQNQVIDMAPYMEQYAPKTMELLGDFVKATTFNGKLAGVPCYRMLNEGYWLTMNKDILNDLGLTEKAESCDNWTTFTEILEAVVAGSDLAGFGPNDGNGSLIENYAFFVGKDKWADSFSFDNLGDQYSFIYCDSNTDTVYNYYATEEYKYAVELAHQWYANGLVFKDAATTDQTRQAQLSGNLSFCITGQGDASTPATQPASCGHDTICVELAPGMIANSNLVKFGYCMPATCKEPEAAAKFLELMYTNADIMNILSWGIEGRDWVVNENGEACYPEGVDGTSVAYHNQDMFFPNCFIAYPWVGLGGDFRETSLAGMKAAPVTKYLGFSCDTSSVANEITACYDVEGQYRAAMNCGLLDPATALPEFLQALENAGIQKIIDCYQSQLDAWIAANK